jgi:hypothetical protein
MELASLEQWTKDHEKADEDRFREIEGKFAELPEEIKKTLNGSVENTVNKQMWGFLRWIGVGGFVLLGSMAVAWGSITTQVNLHTEQLKTTLDAKDLSHINTQLDSQIQSIKELRGDIKEILNKVK